MGVLKPSVNLPKGELWSGSAADAKSSTIEEPREGKLHAGICVGGYEVTHIPTTTQTSVYIWSHLLLFTQITQF